MTINKWGGLASFLLAVSFLIAPLIYLIGNLRDAIGVLAYNLADFLYGPILSASLITVIYVLRKSIGEGAFRRMDLALLAAVLSALGMAAVAFIRASNRHYHLIHPELNLENSTTLLIVWTTLVAGMNAIGFHFLGWMFVLLGSASWTSQPCGIPPVPYPTINLTPNITRNARTILRKVSGLIHRSRLCPATNPRNKAGEICQKISITSGV